MKNEKCLIIRISDKLTSLPMVLGLGLILFILNMILLYFSKDNPKISQIWAIDTALSFALVAFLIICKKER
jgi:hypothetical protein